MLLRDAIRFVRYSRTAIEQAPLQIYSSALIFAPEKSAVRQVFSHAIPKWMRQLPSVEQTWSACLQTLESHTNGVTSVAFSPDGQTLASGSWDSTIKLWDALTGALRSTLEGHTDGVTSVAFSPDGQTLASGSDDSTIKLWDASTGALRNTLKGHKDWVTLVAFSPDGQTLASGSHDSTIKLWDILTGQVLDTTIAGGYISRISFSEDGLLLQTNRGAFSNYPLLRVKSNTTTSLVEIAISASWISWKGRYLLWLPPEYRSNIVAVHNSSVALGQSSGRITFISFNTSF
jgi:WD40 repeat protein